MACCAKRLLPSRVATVTPWQPYVINVTCAARHMHMHALHVHSAHVLYAHAHVHCMSTACALRVHRTCTAHTCVMCMHMYLRVEDDARVARWQCVADHAIDEPCEAPRVLVENQIVICSPPARAVPTLCIRMHVYMHMRMRMHMHMQISSGEKLFLLLLLLEYRHHYHHHRYHHCHTTTSRVLRPTTCRCR